MKDDEDGQYKGKYENTFKKIIKASLMKKGIESTHQIIFCTYAYIHKNKKIIKTNFLYIQ